MNKIYKSTKAAQLLLWIWINKTKWVNDRGGIRGECGVLVAPLFCNNFFFGDHFQELQTVYIEVKLIINNAPLTYI